MHGQSVFCMRTSFPLFKWDGMIHISSVRGQGGGGWGGVQLTIRLCANDGSVSKSHGYIGGPARLLPVVFMSAPPRHDDDRSAILGP